MNDSKSKIELVCFDLGGVVVRLKSGVAAELSLLCPPHRQSLLKSSLRDNFIHAQTEFSFNERYQLGQVTTEEYIAHLLEVFEGTIGEETLRDKALSVIAGHYSETTDLLPKLAKHYKLACFSNTHDLHWSHMQERFAWMQHFTWQLASHLTGIAKPHPDAFHAVCQAASIVPSECLFIDDRQVNIEGAQSIGMQAVLCDDPVKLADALSAAGLKL